jgi:plasmid stabilization system protein ParE
VDAIKAEFDPLRRFPHMGPTRDQFGAPLRVVFHAHYAIYYWPTEHELIIIRVLHGARDTVAITEQGGFRT